MQSRINKPRVFLSHSKLDTGFIEKLANDLRKCQIEPWLDTEEIRDGKPWLKVIFEEGIPTCDAVIVYLTENSISSKMVAKELDATIVEELAESGIRLLPYVSKGDLRGQLRADVRTLQCREWNGLNYSYVFPMVVAEIWRSYTERIVNTAILQEKTRRLELELENRKIQEKYDASVFSASEEKEFNYIRNKLDRDFELTFELLKRKADEKKDAKIFDESLKTNFLNVIIGYLDEGYYRFSKPNLEVILYEKLEESNPLDEPDTRRGTPSESIKENLTLELQTYGLISIVEPDRFEIRDSFCEFTNKMYRFRYWLGYNNYSVGKISFVRKSIASTSPNENEKSNSSENYEIQYARKVAEEVRLQDQRKKWLTTEIGVSSAQQEIEKLYDELKEITELSNAEIALRDTSMRVEVSRENQNQIILSCRGLSLSIIWSCKFDNTLDDSILFVEGYPAKSDMTNGRLIFMDKDRFYQAEYKIDLNEEMKIVWRRNSGGEHSKSTVGLARDCFSYLLSSVRRKSVHGE